MITASLVLYNTSQTEIVKCQALIAPLRKGAGVKVKVIDALSCSTPVIGTDIAFEGISADTENNLFQRASGIREYVCSINNWKNRSAEFRLQYNSNHLPALLETIIQKGKYHADRFCRTF